MKQQTWWGIKQGTLALCLIFQVGCCVQAFSEEPAENKSISERVDALMAHHQRSEAILLLKTALAADPSNVSLRLSLIDLYLLGGQHYEAELTSAQGQNNAKNPYDALRLEAKTALGPSLLQIEAVGNEKTTKRLDELLVASERLNPDAGITHYLLGEKALLGNDPQEAEAPWLRALIDDPELIEAKEALVSLYIQEHRLNLAKPLLTELIEYDAGDINVQYLLAESYSEKGDAENALKYLLEFQKNILGIHPEITYRLADAYQQLGKTDDALNNYQITLQSWPDRPDLWLKVAQIYEGKGQFSDATQAYQKAYQLDPSVLEPFLREAETLFWKDSIYKAADKYRRIVAIAPDRVDLFALLSALYLRMAKEGRPPSSNLLDEIRQQEPLENDLVKLDPTQAELYRVSSVELSSIQSTTPFFEIPAVMPAAMREGAQTPLFQAMAYLIAAQPLRAKTALSQLTANDVSRINLQHLVLLGAWKWGQAAVSQNEAYPGLSAWLQLWAGSQATQADEAITQARQFNASNQAEKALAALQKAQVYDLFSPELYLEQSKSYKLLGQQETSEATLQLARDLGLTKEQEKAAKR